jgi:hypothetical protein
MTYNFGPRKLKNLFIKPFSLNGYVMVKQSYNMALCPMLLLYIVFTRASLLASTLLKKKPMWILQNILISCSNLKCIYGAIKHGLIVVGSFLNYGFHKHGSTTPFYVSFNYFMVLLLITSNCMKAMYGPILLILATNIRPNKQLKFD